MNHLDKSTLRKIANTLLINTQYVDNIGLMEGKTGIAFFFYYYYRHTGLSFYKEYADDLMDIIISSLSIDTPLSMENGLCGIAWAMRRLIRDNFLEADSAEIGAEIDSVIFDPVRSFEFSDSYFSSAIYWSATNKLSSGGKLPEKNTQLLIEWLSGRLEKSPDKESSLKYWNSVLYFLCDIDNSAVPDGVPGKLYSQIINCIKAKRYNNQDIEVLNQLCSRNAEDLFNGVNGNTLLLRDAIESAPLSSINKISIWEQFFYDNETINFSVKWEYKLMCLRQIEKKKFDNPQKYAEMAELGLFIMEEYKH